MLGLLRNFRVKKATSSIIISSFLLMSCASSPEDISAYYVSPLQYQSYNCNQLSMEMQRVGRKVQEITGVQQSESSGDAVALGVGLVIFWPALFFMIGKDKEEELARLKGEYEAIESAAIQKDCRFMNQAQETRRPEPVKQERSSLTGQHTTNVTQAPSNVNKPKTGLYSQ